MSWHTEKVSVVMSLPARVAIYWSCASNESRAAELEWEKWDALSKCKQKRHTQETRFIQIYVVTVLVFHTLSVFVCDDGNRTTAFNASGASACEKKWMQFIHIFTVPRRVQQDTKLMTNNIFKCHKIEILITPPTFLHRHKIEPLRHEKDGANIFRNFYFVVLKEFFPLFSIEVIYERF